MKGKHGNLNGKGKGKGKKQPYLGPIGYGKLVELFYIKGVETGYTMMVEADHENSNEHQQAAKHGIEEELYRSINSTARRAPHPD